MIVTIMPIKNKKKIPGLGGITYENSSNDDTTGEAINVSSS